MENNTISVRNQELFDPLVLKLASPYLQNGLTYVSNNTSIHPRDEAGNIVLQENSEINPLLIIEPVVRNVVNSSVLRVVDTTFQYFKFPVSTLFNNAGSLNDLDIDFSIPTDPIYAYYRPTAELSIPASPNDYSGIDFGLVIEGQPQLYTNSYNITKEIKSSGKDLRFRAKILHRFDINGDQDTIKFSIIRNGVNAGLIRDWKHPFFSSTSGDINSTLYPLIDDIKEAAIALFNVGCGYAVCSDKETEWNNYADPFFDDTIISRLTGTMEASIAAGLDKEGDPGYVPQTNKNTAKERIAKLKEAYNAYKTELNSLPASADGIIKYGEYQTVYIDEIIRNYEFETGDILSIGQKSNKTGHVIYDIQSYWSITDASKLVNEWNQEIL